MDERTTMWEMNVRQPLPKRGEPAADRDRAQAAVSLADAEYALSAGELAADIALALAEAEGAGAQVQLLGGSRGIFATAASSRGSKNPKLPVCWRAPNDGVNAFHP